MRPKRTRVYVQRSRALAKLVTLTWTKLILPTLKDAFIKSRIGKTYRDKLSILLQDDWKRSVSQRTKEFFRDPEVIDAAKVFIVWYETQGKDE